jgi:plastocyanin
MEAAPEPEVMEAAPEPVAFDGTISIPEGSGVPGCDETNECYLPYHVTVSAGEEITWSNDDSAAHTVTSGTPSEGHDGNFDSSLFMSGSTFSVTLDETGEYPYFCMVHPWMTGIVTVN